MGYIRHLTQPLADARRYNGVFRFSVCGLIALVIGFFGAIVEAQQQATLFVFLNAEMKPRALQQLLAEQMPTIEITVFGRYKDFEKSVASLNPDAIVALAPTIEALGLKVGRRGVVASTTDEPYVLLAVDRKIPQNELSGATIGTVDLLGRGRMPGFVGATIGIDADAKIKLVTKTEDLLPLLQFKEADAVLLPERQVSLLTTKSLLSLQITATAKRVSLPSIAARSAAGQGIAELIGALNPATANALGVEGWQ
jgi:hypothetical protein